MKKVTLLTIFCALLVVPLFSQQYQLALDGKSAVKPVASLQLPNALPLKALWGAKPFQKRQIVGIEPIPYRKKTGAGIATINRTSVASVAPGDSVGFTYYDYQTNYAMPDRVVIYPDEGLAQMVWMAAVDPETQTRGSYYALLDISGDDPMPLETQNGWARMEGVRVGWPEIVQFPDGAIGTCAHTPMIFTRNDELGVDVWTTYQAGPDGSLWPRVAIDGMGYLHGIYTYNAGDLTMRLGYIRSTDGGMTWSSETILNGGDLLPLVSADAYVVEARGNTVVVSWIDENATLWSVKSTDNGATWGNPQAIFGPQFSGRATIIDTVDGTDTLIYDTDTVPTVGIDFDMILDADGMAHYVAQITFVFIRGRAMLEGNQLQPIPGTDTLFYIGVGALNIGCGYYKEGTQTVIPMAPPAGGEWDGNGTWPMYDGPWVSMSRYPQLGIGGDGTLYCVYTSVKNGDMIQYIDEQTGDTTDYLYGHLYATYYDAGANAWSEPTDLTPDGVDALFGSLCNDVTDYLYIGYQADFAPGTAITGGYPSDAPSAVMFLAFPVSQLKGVSSVSETSNSGFTVSLYPNPAERGAKLYYTLQEAAPVTVRIVDVLGNTIARFDQGMQSAGTHMVSLNTEKLTSGTYYCTVSAGAESHTVLLKVVK